MCILQCEARLPTAKRGTLQNVHLPEGVSITPSGTNKKILLAIPYK